MLGREAMGGNGFLWDWSGAMDGGFPQKQVLS